MDDAHRLARFARGWCHAALVAALAAGCTAPYMGTTASSFMRHVRDSRDPNLRYKAYTKLASPNIYDNDDQKREAIQLLSRNLISNREPVATKTVICRSLGDLGRSEARPALLQAVNDTDPEVRAEACRALGKVGTTEDAAVLARLMTADTQLDCRIAAIEALGTLKPKDSRYLVMLVQGIEHDDPAIRLASLRSLKTMTGKNLGVDAGPWRTLVEKEIKETQLASKENPPKTDTTVVPTGH
jgi:HEAT repeat protein